MLEPWGKISTLSPFLELSPLPYWSSPLRPCGILHPSLLELLPPWCTTSLSWPPCLHTIPLLELTSTSFCNPCSSFQPPHSASLLGSIHNFATSLFYLSYAIISIIIRTYFILINHAILSTCLSNQKHTLVKVAWRGFSGTNTLLGMLRGNQSETRKETYPLLSKWFTWICVCDYVLKK